MPSKLNRGLGLAGTCCLLALLVSNCGGDSADGTGNGGGGGAAGRAGAAGHISSAGSTNAAGDANEAGNGAEGGVGGAPGPDALPICSKRDALSECDPITATQCDVAAGETCDMSAESGGYRCFPPPNDATNGAFCGDTVFCGAKNVCYTDESVCVHFCCDSSDCARGDCTPIYGGPVGACIGEFIGAAGSSGAGGADDGAAGTGGSRD